MKAVTSERAAQEAKEVYLVLGGNGFIGSHIVDKLSDKGKRVRVLDPFSRPPQFTNPEAVDQVSGSAFDPLALDRALKGVTHVVYSLAATSPFTADTDPYADIENLRHGIEILEGCVRAGVHKVGFISSGGAVYGSVAEHKPATENDAPMPVSPYGICKLTMEHYMEYFRRKHGLEYIVYRLSNPYGPRQAFRREQGVIPAFVQHILHQEDITIFGDGSASRDYIYVEDAARMIAETIPCQNQHTVYNIGSGRQTALNDIVKTIEEVTGRKAAITFAPAPRTTLQKTGLSIQRYEQEYGDPHLLSFQEGLGRTIKQYAATEVLQEDVKVHAQV